MPAKSSGCFTCRKRKIRCDERRPGCMRCARHGVQCPGYVREEGALDFKDQTSSTTHRANLRYLKITTFRGEEDSFEGTSLEFDSKATTLLTSSKTYDAPSFTINNSQHVVPPNLTSASVNREQMYESFMGIFNPKNIKPRSQDFDFFRMLAMLAPSYLVLQDALDALSLMQVGTAHGDQRLLGESLVRYCKALRGIRQALSDVNAPQDSLLATASVLATCEFFDHIKKTPSAWLGHLVGVDQLLLVRGPWSLKSKLSMLLFYQSRYPALSRSLLRRNADPLSSLEWRAILKQMPLGPAGTSMELALQVPELLERYDALNIESPVVLPEAAALLSDCERLEREYQNWCIDSLQPTTTRPPGTPHYSTKSVDSFPTFAALIHDRTLSNGFVFADSKLSFLYRQHWCSQYFLQSTIAWLREYLQALDHSEQRPNQPCSTSDSHIDDLVFSLCRCIPGLAEPITGAHGHTAIFLPLRIAMMHFRSRRLWDWVRWADEVSSRVFYRGIRPPTIKDGDYPEARPLIVPGSSQSKDPRE